MSFHPRFPVPFNGFPHPRLVIPHPAQIHASSHYAQGPLTRVAPPPVLSAPWLQSNHLPPPNPQPPPKPIKEASTNSDQSPGPLQLSCWCGSTFSKTLTAYQHCDSHGYPRHVMLHKSLAQLLSSDHTSGNQSVPQSQVPPEPKLTPTAQQVNKATPKNSLRELEMKQSSTRGQDATPASREPVQKPKRSWDSKPSSTPVQSTNFNEASTNNLEPGMRMRDPKPRQFERTRKKYDPLPQHRYTATATSATHQASKPLNSPSQRDGKRKRDRSSVDDLIESRRNRKTKPASIFPGTSSISSSSASRLVASDDAERRSHSLYTCPSCAFQGRWEDVRFHLRTSGHLAGGVRCDDCGFFCIEFEDLVQHTSSSRDRSLHCEFTGDLYTASEFLLANPFQGKINLTRSRFKITRPTPYSYRVTV